MGVGTSFPPTHWDTIQYPIIKETIMYDMHELEGNIEAEIDREYDRKIVDEQAGPIAQEARVEQDDFPF